MKARGQYIYATLASIFMLIFILDGKTALEGATTGLNLCLRIVIPSLFPFFILTGILSQTTTGKEIPILRPICKLCKIPNGAESILLLGFLAGYPAGAQLVTQAYRDGKITKQTAQRMICFCNNAGPAFLFGLLAQMFSYTYIVWILWLVHILSGLLVGFTLPCMQQNACILVKNEAISVRRSMDTALKTTARICGWVIMCRAILAFLSNWFLWQLPTEWQVLLSGLLELSNGCVRLTEVSNPGLRFILASALLSAGGLCVTMQTMSVSQNVFSSIYFLGKGLQTVFATLFALLLQPLLFPVSDGVHITVGVIFMMCIPCISLIFLSYRKKMWQNKKI